MRRNETPDPKNSLILIAVLDLVRWLPGPPSSSAEMLKSKEDNATRRGRRSRGPRGEKLTLPAVDARPTRLGAQKSSTVHTAPSPLCGRRPPPAFPLHEHDHDALRFSSTRSRERKEHSRFQRRGGWSRATTPVSSIEIELHILCDGFPGFGQFVDKKSWDFFHVATDASTNSIETPGCARRGQKTGKNIQRDSLIEVVGLVHPASVNR